MDKFEVLKEYKGLLDSGAITAEEFEQKKKEILGSPEPATKAPETPLENVSEDVSGGPIEITLDEPAQEKKAGFVQASAAKANARANAKAKTAGNKKPVYKKWWFWVIIVLLVIGLFGCQGGSDEDTPEETTTETVQEDTQDTTEEVAAEEPEEKTPLENATEMGQWWFQNIDWENVFKYKSDIHYIMGYSCVEVTADELKEYGSYVATASADLQNGFGAEFTSTVYIFMDENGVAKHVFYDEADGTSTEIPMDSIPMKNF